MSETPLTAEEYDLSLESLTDRMNDFMDSGQGDVDRLLREAEELLDLKDEFPAIYEDHQEIEGLIAALMAQKQQEEFMNTQMQGEDKREAPGCLLGWLLNES